MTNEDLEKRIAALEELMAMSAKVAFNNSANILAMAEILDRQSKQLEVLESLLIGTIK